MTWTVVTSMQHLDDRALTRIVGILEDWPSRSAAIYVPYVYTSRIFNVYRNGGARAWS